jgi:hypothetical protein
MVRIGDFAKRSALILAALSAGALGATGGVPGWLTDHLGVSAARAHETCPNVDCAGAHFCEFFYGAKCFLSPTRCTVDYCEGV